MWHTVALFGMYWHREALRLAGGTSVSWRRLDVHGLFDHAHDTGGVMALCGLGCASVRLR
jgi:hypothetical protein